MQDLLSPPVSSALLVRLAPSLAQPGVLTRPGMPEVEREVAGGDVQPQTMPGQHPVARCGPRSTAGAARRRRRCRRGPARAPACGRLRPARRRAASRARAWSRRSTPGRAAPSPARQARAEPASASLVKVSTSVAILDVASRPATRGAARTGRPVAEGTSCAGSWIQTARPEWASGAAASTPPSASTAARSGAPRWSRSSRAPGGGHAGDSDQSAVARAPAHARHVLRPAAAADEHVEEVEARAHQPRDEPLHGVVVAVVVVLRRDRHILEPVVLVVDRLGVQVLQAGARRGSPSEPCSRAWSRASTLSNQPDAVQRRHLLALDRGAGRAGYGENAAGPPMEHEAVEAPRSACRWRAKPSSNDSASGRWL